MSVGIQLETLLVGGLVAGRIITFLMVVPSIGMRAVPVPVKLALAFWFAVGAMPIALAQAPPVVATPGRLALAFAGEFLVGMLLSFSVVLLFAAFQMGGQIAGMQIGFTIVNVIDPQTQNQISVISQTYYLVASLIFLVLDGPLIVLRGVVDSFAVLPAGGLGLIAAEGIYELCLSVGGIFVAALKIAAPPVVTLLLVSVTLGIIGRTVSQLNVLIVGFPLKILVGLIMAALSIPFLGQYMLARFDLLYADVIRVAGSLAGGR